VNGEVRRRLPRQTLEGKPTGYVHTERPAPKLPTIRGMVRALEHARGESVRALAAELFWAERDGWRSGVPGDAEPRQYKPSAASVGVIRWSRAYLVTGSGGPHGEAFDGLLEASIEVESGAVGNAIRHLPEWARESLAAYLGRDPVPAHEKADFDRLNPERYERPGGEAALYHVPPDLEHPAYQGQRAAFRVLADLLGQYIEINLEGAWIHVPGKDSDA
jgi:hypothetical protein